MSSAVPSRLRAALAAALLLALDAAGAVSYSDAYFSARNDDRAVRKSTTLIVLHTTEAPAKSSLNKLSERGEAHYCVTEDGTVYRIIDKDRVAFHAGRSMWRGKRVVDDFSVGIEVVGYHNRPVTLKQLESLKELIKELKKKYKIGDAGVVSHSHVAYGAPHKWQKKAHRGRKRCGMLFAMPSVRAELGLAARPKGDPDVRAKRLVNADAALARVLYGPVDTMKTVYAKPKPAAGQSGAKTAANNFWKRVKAKPAAAAGKKPAAARKPPAAGTSANAARPKGQTQAAAAGGAKPARRRTAAANTRAPAAASLPEGIRTIGRDGASIEALAGKEAFQRTTLWFKPDGSWGCGDKLAGKAPLPYGTRVLVGYSAAGQVGPKRTAVSICGSKWKSSKTYYYDGRTLVPGDRIDEKSIRNGTMIFVRK